MRLTDKLPKVAPDGLPAAVLLSFLAPLQFPDGVIRVQLDADLAFEDIDIEIEGVETVTFDGLDEMLDQLSQES